MRLRHRFAAVLRRWSVAIDPALADCYASPPAKVLQASEPVGSASTDRVISAHGVALESTRYFYLGADVAMTRIADGHHMFVDPHDRTIGSHLIAHGYWERWIHAVVLALVSPGDRIIEVGANLGYYTIAMALKTGIEGRVTAYEANPRLCRLMRRTIEFNGYSDRVAVLNKAATDLAGPISFSISRTNSGGGHAGAYPGWPVSDVEQIEVEGVVLDDEIDGEIDFLRMDAEGSEPLILRGAERLLSNPKLTVVMEWDVIQMSGRSSVPELVGWLTAKDFRFWRIEVDATLTPIAAEDMPALAACEIVMTRDEPGLLTPITI